MRRWRVATAQFWQSEPSLALVVYLLLAIAVTGYVHVFGPHLGTRLSETDALLARLGARLGLVEYAFFAWRIWLGGPVSWSLSLAWKIYLVIAALLACYRDVSPFTFGLTVLVIASMLPLFSGAVLDRVDRTSQRTAVRRRREAALAGSG